MFVGMHQPVDPEDFTIEEILVISELFEKHRGKCLPNEYSIIEKLIKLGAKLHRGLKGREPEKIPALFSAYLPSDN